jgi:hypothetical protein
VRRTVRMPGTGKGVWADSACNSGYLLIYQRIVLREHTASAAANICVTFCYIHITFRVALP